MRTRSEVNDFSENLCVVSQTWDIEPSASYNRITIYLISKTTLLIIKISLSIRNSD